MDVEIVKRNGQKFRLSDYGVVQDFVVSSIDKHTNRENIDGRPGAVNYGSYDGDRTITVPFIFKAHDLHDYAHLRDELYGLLDDGEPFYIREMRRLNYLQYEFVDFGEGHKWSPGTDDQYVNGKQILVWLNSVITPEQEFKNGNVDLEFISDELPYFESAYTTLELHDSGYSATAEKYGLVDNIDDEKVKYRFEPSLSTVDLSSSDFELGAISSGSGSNTSSSSEIRTKDYINVAPGNTYTFQDKINGDKVNYWWIFEYDNNGNYLGYFNTPVGGNGRIEFEAKGYRVRVRSVSYSSLSPSDVGTETLPSITGYLEGVQTFSVYNAGNVTVEPEYMDLTILVLRANFSESFTIRNVTTSEEFTYHGNVSRQSILIDGMNVLRSSAWNSFRNTNRRFIRLAPGDNLIEVTGGTFDEIRFDFKYYYK